MTVTLNLTLQAPPRRRRWHLELRIGGPRLARHLVTFRVYQSFSIARDGRLSGPRTVLDRRFLRRRA